MTAQTRSSSRPRRSAAAAIACGALATGLIATSVVASAQDQSAVGIKDVIFARKALKDVVCDRMMEIERMIAVGHVDLDQVHVQAGAISVMLMAFPHLFPPSSNRWKADNNQDPESATLASPDLWTDFPDFYRQAAAAANTASELSRASSIDDNRNYSS